VPDVHVPKLGEHSSKSVWHIALEVVLISAGVFLGLMGEQWRERSHQRELAEQALRRFRTEIVENRKAVADVKDYHATLLTQLGAQFKLPPEKRSGEGIQFHGVRPANFDHSAWDLAIATQSLAFVDPDLALELSKLYNAQNFVAELNRGFIQAMYVSPPAVDTKNETTFFGAVLLYYGDMSVYEPRLLTMYDEALGKIDTAIGEQPADATRSK